MSGKWAERNNRMIEEFRQHGRARSGNGNSILLVTTKGRRTGRDIPIPLVYTRDGERYVVVASAGGQPSHPDWYHNLVAHPIVTVEVEGQRFTAKAELADGAEHERLYAQQAKAMPFFRAYQDGTARRIPVFTLTRITR